MSINVDSISGKRAANNRLIHSLTGWRSEVSCCDRLAQPVKWIQRNIEALDMQNDAR